MSSVQGMKRKLSPDERRTALMLYREGWGYEKIAKRYGVTRQAIYYLVKTRNVERELPPRKEVRDEQGVIVTCKEQGSGDLRSMHEPGLTVEALQALCERIDRMEGRWRILCYSTPITIQGDLRANQESVRSQPGFIEAQALARIDRHDLLDPSVENGHRRESHHRSGTRR